MTGKVAIVTRIGAAIAKSLAAAGSAVVVNYATGKQGADENSFGLSEICDETAATHRYTLG